MPYRLNRGAYSVRCRRSHCPFHARLEVEETIMGVTESDVRAEALRVVTDMARVRHDSIHGRDHQLQNPEIHMVAGTIQLAGAGPVQLRATEADFYVREYSKGDVILKKGEEAGEVCEVLRGVAYPRRNVHHRYSMGDCFGVAALLPNHNRMTDVVAGTDRTKIAFYHLTNLNRRDPKKASNILNKVIEDTLKVIGELEPERAVTHAV
ncbi:MAG TPA: cyclic nucleotide-binding domain-containing protein [Spirochaetia bacterium]